MLEGLEEMWVLGKDHVKSIPQQCIPHQTWVKPGSTWVNLDQSSLHTGSSLRSGCPNSMAISTADHSSAD
ncbi:hypothetical protein RRG08_062718 [Elysia crispata]|uniref:Uncharacterized protein n=1 Tax=Elysia crispata TaxID=231223 RepID=A0AAE1ABR6_9GAST|nr:hypothetical protein RRG08_062718 [Elysia crispata]